MTFTAQVREELIRVQIETAGEAAYVLYGARFAAGEDLYTTHTGTARALLVLARAYPERFGASEMTRTQKGRFGGENGFILKCERMPEELPLPETQEHCSALLRGAFLLRGTAGSPDKGAQAALSFASEEGAQIARQILSQLAVSCSMRTLRGKWRIEVRGREPVADLFAFIGAMQATMDLQNAYIMHDIVRDTQRKVNFDTANIERTRRSGQEQIAFIEHLQNTTGLAKLPGALREIAQLRLDHPFATLEELGAMLNPPIGKSGVQSRLRRLAALEAKIGKK